MWRIGITLVLVGMAAAGPLGAESADDVTRACSAALESSPMPAHLRGLAYYQDFDHGGGCVCDGLWACSQRVDAFRLDAGRFGKGYPNENHVRNFLDCVKSRRQPIAPAEGAHRANSTCQIANICLQLQRPLKWNPEQERFVGDPDADRMLARTIREPWRL